MIPLLLLSLLSIYIFFERLQVIRRAAREDNTFMERIKDYIHEGDIDSALKLCKKTNTPYSRLIAKGISRLGRPMNDVLVAIENVGNIEIAKLEKGFPWLATTYADGTTEEVYGYDIPVEALDTDFQLALLGTKGKWYDHTVSVRNAEPKTEQAAETPADGAYTAAVVLEGGSGRATVESPAALTVADGKMTATIVWSSPNYDYMLVNGEKYLPVNTEGNSVFEVPVEALDAPLTMIGDTVAMSTPHEVEYTVTFHSETLESAESGK